MNIKKEKRFETMSLTFTLGIQKIKRANETQTKQKKGNNNNNQSRNQ